MALAEIWIRFTNYELWSEKLMWRQMEERRKKNHDMNMNV